MRRRSGAASYPDSRAAWPGTARQSPAGHSPAAEGQGRGSRLLVIGALGAFLEVGLRLVLELAIDRRILQRLLPGLGLEQLAQKVAAAGAEAAFLLRLVDFDLA